MTGRGRCYILSYMKREKKYGVVVALRMTEDDHACLEATAKRWRTGLSSVIRRYVAEGLDREAGAAARRPKKRGKKP